MKRKIIVIGAVVLILLIFACVSFCCADRIENIKSAYLKMREPNALCELYPRDVSILKYFGTYNGADALLMTDAEIEGCLITDGVQLKLAGVEFDLNSQTYLCVYKNNKIYTLKEACDAGYLSDDDIVMIGNLYRGMKFYD